MSDTKFYTVTKSILLRLKNSDRGFCCRCKKVFQEGDKIIRKGRSGNSRYYHQECFNSMFH